MKRVLVRGWGAVSPAGWGVAALRDSVARGQPVPLKPLACPGVTHPLYARVVPPRETRPAYMAHARLRRTSPIAQYVTASALEALGPEAAAVRQNGFKLGIVLCVMSGCVIYSRRFYSEALADPATASPLVFPETVFNAPASHLGALLGTTGINYTLVGDPGTYLQGLAVAAEWLLDGRVQGCLVVGAEELDWMVTEAYHLFNRYGVLGEGAGALYLTTEPGTGPAIELAGVTHPQLYSAGQSPSQAARRARQELNGEPANQLLCDGLQGVSRLDRSEVSAWGDWPGRRLSPKKVCGEAFTAAAAWQCVVGVDALATQPFNTANISVVGCNEQAIAARFVKSS